MKLAMIDQATSYAPCDRGGPATRLRGKPSKLWTRATAPAGAGRLAIAAAALLLAAPGMGRAQTVENYFSRNNNVSVLERPHPEFSPIGFDVSTFHFLPNASAQVSYNDNIFAANSGKTGDVISSLAANIAGQSQWARNEIDISAGINSNFYSKYSAQNYSTYNLGGSGRLDFLDNWNVLASLSYNHAAQTRTVATTITTSATTIQDDQISAGLSALQTITRLQFSENVSYNYTAYANSTTFTGVPLNLNYLDSRIVYEGGRADFAVDPSVALFASVTANQHYFNYSPIRPRDSTGYDLGVGTDFDITSLARGTVQFGYLEQKYKSPLYHTVSGFSAHGQVAYFPSTLLTITYIFDRQVVDAVDPLAVSFIQTKNSIQGDYELFPQLIISGQGSYETDGFTGIQRQDKRTQFSLTGTYLIGNHLGIRGGYVFVGRQSTGVFRAPSFVSNVASFGLVFQL